MSANADADRNCAKRSLPHITAEGQIHKQTYGIVESQPDIQTSSQRCALWFSLSHILGVVGRLLGPNTSIYEGPHPVYQFVGSQARFPRYQARVMKLQSLRQISRSETLELTLRSQSSEANKINLKF